MFAKVKSEGIYGINTFNVTVEADISGGMPRFDLVGLPDAAVKESRERVRASIKNCGFNFPDSRITVNIAPADVKKEGSFYDLPIFAALLKASSQIKTNLDDYAFIGELSLDGEIRPVNGILPMVLQAKEDGVVVVWSWCGRGAGYCGSVPVPGRRVAALRRRLMAVMSIRGQP